jgi:butyryl-CoA dehydrogenase
MEYFLTEEQKMIREVARKVAEEKIKPIRQELDEKGEFPYEIMKELARVDLFRVFLPPEYDGMGGGVFGMCLVVEELSRICGGVAISYAVVGLGSFPILISGSEEQKKKYLPKVAAGECLTAFCLTEAEAGSDAANMQTTAVRDGDSYILNGTKQFITNGGIANLYTVIASTDKTKGTRGLSAFLVERDMKGVSFGKEENKMGIRASKTTEVVMQNVRVPKENLIGSEGLGFVVAMRTLDKSRPGVGAQAVGIAQGALEEALAYAQKRVQFGQPIINFQAIQFMLADMATKIEAARAMVYSTARMIDAGVKEFSKEAAMTKLFASNTAMEVTVDAVQILGGYGYMRDYPVEKMMRDAKITQIYEGTNQIQRLVIANRLIRESAGK